MTTSTSTAERSPDLAIVIPALNERENLELLLPAVKDIIAELGLTAEIVVVDGGSTDGTQQVTERLGARVAVQAERGYGGALITGFGSTTAPYVVTMDADLSHRPLFLDEFWRRRHEGEVLIASRYVPGGSADMNVFRRMLSIVLNRTYSRVLALPIRDLSSGFRMYRRRVLEGLSLIARDFDVLEELLIRVDAAGWRIQEVPFRYMARGTGRSHARLFKFGLAFLKTLRRMWRLRNSVEAADYDARAFDSPIWPQRYWQRARHRVVLGYIERPESVLDVGCGSSRILTDLPKAVGFDLLFYKLRWLSWRHRLVVQGDCNQLPFPAHSFETVISSEVIEHIPKTPEVFTELWRVLRPGGILIVGTPDYGRWLWWVIEWVYGKVLPGAYAHEHISHFTRDGLERLLKGLGFDVLDCRYVGFCEMIFKARKPQTSEGSHGPPGR